MHTDEAIIDLKNHFHEKAWPWIIAPLLRDPLIWTSLRDLEFREYLFHKLGNDPNQWTPAHIALLALSQTDIGATLEIDSQTKIPKPETLRETPLQPINSPLRQSALQALDDLHDSQSFPRDLIVNSRVQIAHAGLLSLALRERSRLTGSWDDISDDLFDTVQFPWNTTLACLYGILPTPQRFLTKLSVETAVQIVFANPNPPDERFVILRNLLVNRSETEIPPLLDQIKTHNKSLARSLAIWIIENIKEFDLINEKRGDHYLHKGSRSTLQKIITTINKIQIGFILHFIHQHAEKPNHALQHISNVQKASKSLQEKLTFLLTQTTTQIEMGEHKWDQFLSPEATKLSPEHICQLAVILLTQGKFEAAKATLNNTPFSPEEKQSSLYLFANAYLATEEKKWELAREYAIGTLYAVEGGARLPEDFPDILAQLLYRLNLPQKSAQATKIALQSKPNDPDLLAHLARVQFANQQIKAALESIHIAVALAPEQLDFRRLLCEILDNQKNWDEALNEHKRIVDLSKSELDKLLTEEQDDDHTEGKKKQHLNDLLAYARCALKAHKPQKVIEICQTALEINTDDGLFHTLLGDAYNALGDLPTAYEHYEKSTILSPHLPDPWLALAKAKHLQEDKDGALEILQTAIQAAPKEPEIYLALGQFYSEERAPTEALTAYRKAAELAAQHERNPDDHLNLEIALHLGNTLNSLGHYQEAKRVLESANAEYPSHPELAYLLAKSLLELNDPETALAPLITTLRDKPQNPGPYLDYASALLDVGESPEKAVQAIRSALEIEPEHLLALAMLPEALAANGELNAAVEGYRRALESELHIDPKWSPRLYLGLGRAYLELGQPDVALATLQQGIQADPQNLDIAHTIVDAYQAANLLDESKQSAQAARQLAPEDIDNLIWFSEKACELKVPNEAIEALREAIDLSPQRVDLLVLIGEIQQSSGDRKSAKDTFSKVASTEYAKIPDLRYAARHLVQLKEAEVAVQSLKRAINTWEEEIPKDGTSLDDLWYELALAYHLKDNKKDQLNALDQAISISPERTELYTFKAKLLVDMDRTQAAIVCLKDAIENTPENPELHYRSAHIHRKAGNLVEALNQAHRATESYSRDSQREEALAARGLAAELACILLQEDQAYSYIETDEPINNTTKVNPQEKNSELNPLGVDNYWKQIFRDQLVYQCLRAELCLKKGNEISAANALTEALILNPNHPRVQALRSRLSARQGSLDKANRILEDAMQTLGRGLENEDAYQIETSDISAIADATQELLHWDGAIYLLGQIQNTKNQEPLTSLQLARALVLRAEAQRLYQKVEAIKHAPGDSALSSEAYQSYVRALETTEQLLNRYPIEQLDNDNYSKDEVINGQLHTWKARGQAIFNPNDTNVQVLASLPPGQSNRTAYLAAMLQIKEMDTAAQFASSTYENDDLSIRTNPKLLAYIALALIKENPGFALKVIQEAIQEANRISLPNRAIYYVLQSQIAILMDDPKIAIQSMNTALQIWDDEPRWHAQIAEIIRKYPQSMANIGITTGISHLEEAIRLEPEYANHHLTLGEFHLRTKNSEAALDSLERAKNFAPDASQVWLALAKAYRLKQNPDRAIHAVQRAVEIASDQVEPHLLMAEIALEMGNPQKSRQEAEIVLGMAPENQDGILTLTRALVELDQSLQAINILESAIQVAPNSLRLALERVYLFRKIHGPEVALDTIIELVDRYPSDERIITAQAEILADNGKTEEALQTAREALNIDKPNGIKPEERAKIYRLMGGLERRKGQLDQAVHNLNEAIQIMPDWPDPYLELGHTYLDRRQHDQALQSYQHAISIAPRDPRPYYYAGLVLKDVKDYLEAEVMLRRAADLAPNDLRIHRQLGAMVALNIVHNRNQVSLPGLNNG